jgi:transcriptional regulator with XRE-family HTH domain
MNLTPEQSRAARGLLKLPRPAVAKSAHVGVMTLIEFESGSRTPTYNNRKAIREALEAAGVAFVDTDTGGGPGVRLRTAPAEPSGTPSPEQLRAGRMMAGLSQTQLADAAGLGRSTVADYERRARVPNAENLAMLGSTLEKAGIVFIPADGGGPGVRLKAG